MARKLPYMQFYPSDWLADTRFLTPLAKAAWIDTLAVLWSTPRRGALTESTAAWARLWACSPDEAASIMDELSSSVAAVTKVDTARWCVGSRRMVRDEVERERSREAKKPENERAYPYRDFVERHMPTIIDPDTTSPLPLEPSPPPQKREPKRTRLYKQIIKLLAIFNINADPAMLGSALNAFMDHPQFLEDSAIKVIKQKAPDWLAQDWIKDVNPRFIAERLSEIYHYTPNATRKRSTAKHSATTGTLNEGKGSAYAGISTV